MFFLKKNGAEVEGNSKMKGGKIMMAEVSISKFKGYSDFGVRLLPRNYLNISIRILKAKLADHAGMLVFKKTNNMLFFKCIFSFYSIDHLEKMIVFLGVKIQTHHHHPACPSNHPTIRPPSQPVVGEYIRLHPRHSYPPHGGAIREDLFFLKF